MSIYEKYSTKKIPFEGFSQPSKSRNPRTSLIRQKDLKRVPAEKSDRAVSRVLSVVSQDFFNDTFSIFL
jgi:hypothetical protein